jgi:hypothetical protein
MVNFTAAMIRPNPLGQPGMRGLWTCQVLHPQFVTSDLYLSDCVMPRF